MQPLDPQKPDPSGQAPQPPHSSSGSPYAPPPPPQPPTYAGPPVPPYGGPQQQPPYSGQPPYGGAPLQIPGAEKKVPAALCGILLGCFGVHKFILGYNTEGIIMLAIGLGAGIFTCGIATGIVGIIGLIEGIIYLTKSDQQFVEEYVVNKKTWF